MTLAHSTEGKIKMATQEERLKALETKIVDILDERMARIEIVQDRAAQKKVS